MERPAPYPELPESPRLRRVWMGSALGAGIFLVSLIVLHGQLRSYRFQDLVAEAARLAPQQLGWALLLTLLGYVWLGGYDVLALRFLRRDVPLWQVGIAAFVGSAFSHTLGMAGLAGGSLRYRLYAAHGLGLGEVAVVMIWNGWSVALGFVALAGAVLVDPALVLPPFVPLGGSAVTAVGWGLLILLAAWIFFNGARRRPWRFWGREVPVVSARLAGAQILVGVLDWLAASAVLFVLLPSSPQLGFQSYLLIFLVAHATGVVSAVPGGLGVFDSAILLFLSPVFPPTTIVGVLLVYRGIYYLLPFGLGALYLLLHALGRRRRQAPLPG